MAPATIFSGILPALAIVMSTMPIVPTVPSAVPNSMLTAAVIKKAQTMKMEGLIKSMPVAIIIGITPAACHMAMSQPMRRKICISFAIKYKGHDAPYDNQGVTNGDAIGYSNEDDENRCK